MLFLLYMMLMEIILEFKETVRKIRKLGIENAAEILSISDKSAALKFLWCFILKEGFFQKKKTRIRSLSLS
mgnify:CR=1 FL=1